MATSTGIISSAANPSILTAAAGASPSSTSSTTVPQITAAPTSTVQANAPASTTMTSVPATAGGTPATGYNATQLTKPTQWNVTPDQTVSGQLGKILDPNSPIIQQAMTQGRQLANDSGLANSSMAQTAAQSAAYQAAVPIANADAQTAAKSAGYNADESNQFSTKNADYSNTASQFDANASNQAKISQLQSDTQKNLAQLDSTTRMSLENIEAQYHELMQSNQTSGDLFRQITQNITNISMSNQMDQAAKQQAVDNQTALLKNGMAVNGAVSNLNLGALLDFSGVSGATTDKATQEVNQATGQQQAANGDIWRGMTPPSDWIR